MRRNIVLYRSGFRARATAGAASGRAHAHSAGPLDQLSGVTGAYSLSRSLLQTWTTATYADVAGAITTVYDQTGNNREFTDAATSSRRPALTTAGPNSRACADFDGSTDVLTATGAGGIDVATFFNNNSGYIAISCLPDSIVANQANIYDNEGLICDSGSGFLGIFFKTGDIAAAYNWDGNNDNVTTSVTEGTPYVFEWRHDSGTLYLRVNGGTEVSVASGNTSTLTGTMKVGNNRNASPTDTGCFDGKVFEWVMFDTVPSLGQRDNLVANMKAWIGA